MAAWLRQKLTERRIETRKAYQEDWGWELPVKSGDHSYYLCVSGNPEGSNVNPNDGEWGIIVEKKRSILQRMTRKGKITENDPLAQAVYEMLSSERSIRDVRFEGR